MSWFFSVCVFLHHTIHFLQASGAIALLAVLLVSRGINLLSHWELAQPGTVPSLRDSGSNSYPSQRLRAGLTPVSPLRGSTFANRPAQLSSANFQLRTLARVCGLLGGAPAASSANGYNKKFRQLLLKQSVGRAHGVRYAAGLPSVFRAMSNESITVRGARVH